MSINIKLVNEDCWESRKLSKCIPLKFYLIQLIRGRRSKAVAMIVPNTEPRLRKVIYFKDCGFADCGFVTDLDSRYIVLQEVEQANLEFVL